MAYRFPISKSRPPLGADVGTRRTGLYTNRPAVAGGGVPTPSLFGGEFGTGFSN